MSNTKALHRGAHSDQGRAVQAATNRRLRSRGLAALAVKEDGVVGGKTLEAIRKAAWALGLKDYDAITRTGTVPGSVQDKLRHPSTRDDDEMARGKRRVSRMRTERKKRVAAAAREKKAHGTSSRTRAVNAFLSHVGVREQPPGSNAGGLITVMQVYWGFGHVAWCGISEGYHAKKYGGMVGLQSDVASVAAIESHARAGHQPYGAWHNDVSGLLPGSFLIIGGYGVHTEMKVDDLPEGAARTVGGNTSFGPGGSQSNGGCIAARSRSNAEIRGGAAMSYPR